MTVCNKPELEFKRCKNRKVQANFKGGNITSDGGVLVLNQVDEHINLTNRIASMINDSRCKGKIGFCCKKYLWDNETVLIQNLRSIRK